MADSFIFVKGSYYNATALKDLSKAEFKKQLGHLSGWEEAYNQISKGKKKPAKKRKASDK